MKKLLVGILTIILTITLTACGGGKSEDNKKVSADNKLNVYTTVFAFQSFIEQIGGKYVNVKSIYPKGTDIHSYEPTQKEMTNIAKSDLFVYSSDDMDPVAKKIGKAINKHDKKLQLTKDMAKKDIIKADEDEDTQHDPHVWLDPVLNKKFAKEIKDELIAKDSKHKQYYEDNYKKLIKDIDHIDQQMKDISKNKKRDKVIISHDSLGYLAKRYDFEQEGVNGMNDDEPSQKKVMDIVKEIKKSKQPYVLYEQNIPDKTTDVIKSETDTKPLSFHNMAVLTKDDKDATYQSLMAKNIKTLRQALTE